MLINRIFKRIKRFVLPVIMVFAMAFSQIGITAASEDKQTLEDYLEELRLTIESYNDKLDEIYNSMDDVNNRIAENQTLLEDEEKSLAEQKVSMAKRIQFMYEAGSGLDIFTALLSSDSISDALNKASYILEVVTWDRQKFNEYVDTVETIQQTQEDLEDEQAQLIELKADFEDAKYEAMDSMSDVEERLAEFDVPQEDVVEIITDYMEAASDYQDEEQVIENDQDEAEPDEESYDDSGTEAEPDEESYDDSGTDAEPDEESYDDSGTDAEPDEESYDDSGTDVDSGDSEDANTDTEQTYAETETTTYEESQETEYDDEDNPEDDSEDDSGDDSGSDSITVPINTYGYSEQDVWDLARITYLENGCVYPTGSYTSIYLTACVVINNANAYYGGNLRSFLFSPGAYSTAYKYTSWGGGELVINDVTWQAVEEALANTDPNPYFQCNGTTFDGKGLTLYYRDPGSNESFYCAYGN